MVTKTGIGVAGTAIILLVAGVLSGYREVVALGATAAVALALGAVWMLFRPDLEAERYVTPTRVSVGGTVLAHLTVHNVGRRRSAPLIADEQFGSTRLPVSVPSLARNGLHTMDYELPANRRGIFQVGPLHIGHADPLRLLRVVEERGDVRRLWVYPRVHAMVPLPAGRNRDLDGPTSGVAPQGGIAFHTLREYVVGDDLRLIHWKSSARAGKLMVRHNVDTNQPRVMVLLETRRAAYKGDEFEEAVSAAASIASGAATRHFPLQLRTTSGYGAAAAIGESPQPVLDLLAAVQHDDQGSASDVLGRGSMAPGMSLAYVGGRISDADVVLISSLRRRFDLLCVCQLTPDPNPRVRSIPDAVSLSGAAASDLARSWNARFAR